jgi:hypothetical protein
MVKLVKGGGYEISGAHSPIKWLWGYLVSAPQIRNAKRVTFPIIAGADLAFS